MIFELLEKGRLEGVGEKMLLGEEGGEGGGQGDYVAGGER